MPDILIKNTRIYYNNSLQPAEIIIEGGKVTKIGKDLRVSSSDMIIDAEGALTLPAGIDVHVHFREPGMTSKGKLVYGLMCGSCRRNYHCYRSAQYSPSYN